MRLSSAKFIRHFLLHVLPAGVKRVGHYGVLANGCKKTQLAQARQALRQPAPNPQSMACAQAFMARVGKIDVVACPRCYAPLRVAQSLPGLKYLPAPGAHPFLPQPVGGTTMSTPRQPCVPACVITASRWVRLRPTGPASVSSTCAGPIISTRVSRAITHLGFATH